MKVAVKMKDGSVRVMEVLEVLKGPNHSVKRKITNKAIQEEIDKWIDAADVVEIIKEPSLPKDRVFRNAWKVDSKTKSLDIDMDKAKELHIDRLRMLRAKQMKKLDIEFMRAVELNDVEKKTEIARLKQKLRNMPETHTMDDISDPDTLKMSKPSYLEGDITEMHNAVPKKKS